MFATDRRRKSLYRLSAVMLVGVLPSLTQAEGARRRLDCQVVSVCDAAAHCEPGTGRYSFVMEPLELGHDGAGRYALSYGEIEAEMQAMSESGPFLWNLAQERNALIASSETEWLWHRLSLASGPEATVSFLECSFEQ